MLKIIIIIQQNKHNKIKPNWLATNWCWWTTAVILFKAASLWDAQDLRWTRMVCSSTWVRWSHAHVEGDSHPGMSCSKAILGAVWTMVCATGHLISSTRSGMWYGPKRIGWCWFNNPSLIFSSLIQSLLVINTGINREFFLKTEKRREMSKISWKDH